MMPRRSRFRITAAFALSIAMLAATQVILGQSRVAIMVDVGKTLATWNEF